MTCPPLPPGLLATLDQHEAQRRHDVDGMIANVVALLDAGLQPAVIASILTYRMWAEVPADKMADALAWALVRLAQAGADR